MSKTINLGKVSLTPKGEWAANISYEKLDVVSHKGEMWISKTQNIAKEPKNESEDWSLAISAVNSGEILKEICYIDSSLNMLDINSLLYGKYMKNNSDDVLDGEYNLTDYIKVCAGQNITFQYDNGTRKVGTLNYVTAFDENKTLVAELGANNATVYTVPDRVKYIKCSISKEYSGNIAYLPMITDSIDVCEYFNYATQKQMLRSEKLTGDDLGEALVKLENLDFAESENCFDPDNKENVLSNRLDNGKSVADSTYLISHYIRVRPNTRYNFFFGRTSTNEVICCQYDINKKYISSLGTLSGETSIVTDSNTRYIKVSITALKRYEFVVLKDGADTSNLSSNIYIPRSIVRENEIPLVFLPDTLRVLKYKTVEIYNKSICPTAYKYRFFWKCDIGKAHKRKFSFKNDGSVSPGIYPLTLTMYNERNKVVFEKTVDIKVLGDIGDIKYTYICSIGDELCKSQLWMKHVRELTANKISFLGSQGSTASLKGEYVNGWSADIFVNYESYTEDGVSKQNPCWKNGAFYWKGSEYVFSQTDPFAFCIALGRNDLISAEGDDYERYVINIRTIIDGMKATNSKIPIFVILPVCWSCDDGIIESARTEATFEGREEEELNYRIIKGAKRLYEHLNTWNLENVYCVPTTAVFDSQYNYSATEETVNSNLSIKNISYGGTRIPSEKGSAQISESFFAYMFDVMGNVLRN